MARRSRAENYTVNNCQQGGGLTLSVSKDRPTATGKFINPSDLRLASCRVQALQRRTPRTLP